MTTIAILETMATSVGLPHVYPFLFHPHEGKDGTLSFAPSASDFTSRGGPLPVWVVVEAFAQAAGVMAASEGSSGGVLVQVAKFRCPRPPLPGDRWSIEGKLLLRMGPLLRVKVIGKSGESTRAKGVFTLREERR